MASFAGIFVWWFFSVLLALLAWPLTYRLFQWLPDRGLAFSRLVGWLFTGYLAWCLGFISNSWFSSVLAWAALGFLSWSLFKRRREEHLEFLKANTGLLFVYELAFLALFFIWSVVRMKHSNIEGQEKFMDFAFLNSMFRSVRMPPLDPWLAGAHNYVNYYYFGYFLNAAFARLTLISHDIVYNLAISNDYALCGLAALGLGFNLTRALWPGLVGVLSLQVFGNLHGALQVLGWQWDQPFSWWEPTRLIKDVSVNGHYLNRWWWSASPASLAAAGLGPDATRDGLISEFPSFSFLHGDLHPHVSGLPLTLLVLALGLNVARNPKAEAVGLRPAFDAQAECLLALVLALGAVFMANTWDLPAYGFLTSVLILAQLHAGGNLGPSRWAKAWLLPSALLLLGLLLAATPFLAFFSNPTKGFGMSGAHTGLRDTLVFWGLFLAVLLPYAMLRLKSLGAGDAGTSAAALPSLAGAAKPAKAAQRLCTQCGAKLRPGKDVCGQCGHVHAAPAEAAPEPATQAPPAWAAAWLKLCTRPGEAFAHPSVKFGAPVLLGLWLAAAVLTPTIAVFSGLAALSCLALAARGGDRESLFVAALVLVGSMLVLATECVYLRDVFEGNPAITRMNTVFKFYFQAWILFSVALPFALWWTLRRLRAISLGWNLAYASVFLVLALAALVYPVQAIAFVWNDFDQNARFAPTLDGAAWFERDYPADFAAVQDLRALPGQPVIAEAVGDAYTHFARVSAYTGFRSVLGWGNHESQWRPSGWPMQTQNDVNELFSTADPKRALQLLAQYQVDYVFVGQLEREKYGAGVDKFAQILGAPVINEMGTLVYKVPSPQTAQ
ncbi:MAG TPA: DUF2298 domain-containing protein [bacterium]|nr:DUF2298 domain-containing protein [bacterium]